MGRGKGQNADGAVAAPETSPGLGDFSRSSGEESLYKHTYVDGEWKTSVNEKAVESAAEKRKEAARRRKERDALLKKAVEESGADALKNIAPITIGFRPMEGFDLNSDEAFMRPCIEVTPIVNPLMDAVLQKLGLTFRGRRTYSMAVGEKASSKSLIAALQALPGQLIYNADQLEKVEKQGHHINNQQSCWEVTNALSQTPVGQAVGYNLNSAVYGRSYTAYPMWQPHVAIQVSCNGKELFIKFVTLGEKKSKGLYLFDGAPSLNLLRNSGTIDPIKVTADVAVALYGAAQEFDYPLPHYGWMDQITEQMKTSVIAQAIHGSPGEARLIIGESLPKPSTLTFEPLYGESETQVARASSLEVGNMMAGYEKVADRVVLHPQVADVIEMATQPYVEYSGLLPYQNEVVRRHLATDIGFLNVCATGLGKTVMTLRGFREKAKAKNMIDLDETTHESYRSLVVMQKTLLDQWENESGRHFPEATVIALPSTAASRIKAMHEQIAACEAEGTPFVVITSYETVKGAWEELAKYEWDDMAVDEAVVLVSTSAERSKALWALRKHAKVGLGLTGTPIERSLDDMGRMLAWARNDDEMFHGQRLSQRFDVTQEWSLNAMWKAIGPTVVRFDRSELKEFLPEIETDVVPLTPVKAEDDLANGARKHLKDIYLKMVDKIEKLEQMNPDDEAIAEAKAELQSARGAVLGGITLARIAASDPVAVAASDSIGAALLESEGLIDPAAKHGGTKRAFTQKLVKKHVQKGDAVIIFTDFSSVADHMYEDFEEAGLNVGIFKGGMNEKVRVETKERFQGTPCTLHEAEMEPGAVKDCPDCLQPDLDVLVLTKAAMKGLNLQRANVLVHYDLPWLPSDVIQRVGRASRYGTKHNHLQVYIPIMKGTVEERVAALLVPRAITAMQALDGYRGVDARETEIGMSMKGLAENVSREEQGENVSIFDLAKELLADDKKAKKEKKAQAPTAVAA